MANTNTEKIVVQVVVQGEKDLQRLEKRTGTTTKSFGKMAAGILGAVAAFKTIVTLVSAATRTFRDFEFQMAKVKAVTGASDRDFRKLQHSARELGRTTFFTATQVGSLQEGYAKLGFSTQEILDAQEATINLATATSSDLARAAIVAGSAIRGFGLDASETKRVTDVMAVAFTSSAMDIEKWQTSMTKVAPIAKSAGFSIEDTAAIMSKLADSGIEASIAGTSFRNILLKMQSPTSDLTKTFGKTIHSFDELLPAMKKFVEEGGSMADIMEVVDLRQAAAFEQMLTSADSAEKLRDAMLDANDAAKKMSDTIKGTLEGDLRELTSAWEGLQEGIVEGSGVVSTSLRSFIDVLTLAANKVTDWIKGTDDLALDVVAEQMAIVNTQLKDQEQLFKNLSEEDKKIYGKETSELIQQRIDDLESQREEQERILRHNRTLNKDYSEQTQRITVLNGAIAELNQTKAEELKKEEEITKQREIKNKITDKERITLGQLKDELKELKETRDLLSVTDSKALERNQKQIDALQKRIDKINGVERSTKKLIKTQKEDTIFTKIEESNINQLLTLQERLLSGKITQAEFDEQNAANQIRLLDSVLRHSKLTGEERAKIQLRLNELKIQDIQDTQSQIQGIGQLGDSLINLAGQDEKYQEVREVGIKLSAAAALANNLEALSLQGKALSRDLALGFPANLIAVASTLALLMSIKSNIAALSGGQKMADGGMVQGKSHAQGGEKFAVGGRVVELEGGEAVINKRSTAMFRSQLSAINAAGGGVKFADGGLLNMPSFSQQQFNALGQNQMMGAMAGGNKVVVVEADITASQNAVSVIQSDATV